MYKIYTHTPNICYNIKKYYRFIIIHMAESPRLLTQGLGCVQTLTHQIILQELEWKLTSVQFFGQFYILKVYECLYVP